MKDVLGNQAHPRRTVKNHILVFVLERSQAAVQTACRVFGLLKNLCQVAMRQRSGKQVQMREISRLDALFKILPALRKNLLPGFELGLDAKVIGGRSLRVKVAEQGPGSGVGSQIGEIDGRGRFPHPTFHMVERHNLHLTPTLTESFHRHENNSDNGNAEEYGVYTITQRREANGRNKH